MHAAADTQEKEPGTALALPMTIAELIKIRADIIQAWRDVNDSIERVDHAFAGIRDKDFHFQFESFSERTGSRG